MSLRATSKQKRPRAKFTVNSGALTMMIPLCVLFLAFGSSSLKAQDGRVVGNVLNVEGEWYLDGRPGQALSKGADLPPGGVIRIPSPSPFAFIIIRSKDNQIINKRCRNAGECAQPILLPRAVQHTASYWETIAEPVMNWFRGHPASPSVNAGRSADGALREAVVRIKDGQIDLAPVFTDMNDGTYYVTLERKATEGKTADGGPSKPIEVKWGSANATTTPAAKFPPGLYEIVLLEKRGSGYKPTLATAWFLAGGLDQYAQTVGPFCEATRLTATWQKDVSEGTVRDFHRAFLIHLAAQPTQSTK